MTALKSLGSIAIALAIGFLWLRFAHDPAVRRDAAARARLDSLQASAHADSAVAAARDSTARADSAVHANELAAAHRVTVAIAEQANALVPRVRASVADSAKAAFDALVRAKDSTVAATARERDLERADKIRALTLVAFYRDTVAVKLRKDLANALGQAADALKRANRHWHVGAAAGYGMTAHGGIVYAGPTLLAGVTYTP